jgi:predicted amidophosphoribosyltransferase
MSNAFQINTKQGLKKGHYLIIDDIFTTGATLNACIKILNKQPGISLSIGVIAYRN